MIYLKDGGVLVIPEETKEKWLKLYPTASLNNVLYDLNESGAFQKCSKQKALKVINKRLKEIQNDNN